MSKFLTDLDTKDRSEEKPQKIRFEVISPLVYQSDAAKRTITVPDGFVTDFASIPQALWNVLPPIGGYDEAAVVHDYLYSKFTNDMDRSTADHVLDEAMCVLGVSAWKRKLIYAGVRVGGWHAWSVDKSSK